MIFNSFEFLIFFPVTCLVYFLLPHRFRWIHLVTASCIFYGFFIPKYLFILFFLILVDYFAGLLIESAEGPEQIAKRRSFLYLSLGANLAILFSFKYLDFFSTNLNLVFTTLGWKSSLPLLKIILPIGLSFHTFQAMSYTIEVYYRRVKAERHLGFYALYVLFFPQLVAGPIERPQNLLHQFRRPVTFEPDRITSGLRLMLVGFMKKTVIADGLAVYVNEVYDNLDKYGHGPVALAILFFSFQILCDFSGYSDIARGSARVLGIELMENFRAPYLATSIHEFWQKWHISLSTWFRDYLYIPLGGSRCSQGRRLLNVLIVFVVSGFWHGANWTFLAWGLLHGIFTGLWLVAGKSPRLPRWIGMIFTFSLVSGAWVFFRAPSFSSALAVFRHLVPKSSIFGQGFLRSLFDPIRLGELDPFNVRMGVIGAVLLWAIQAGTRHTPSEGHWKNLSPGVRYVCYVALILAILNSGTIEKIPFIYFQF